MTEVELASLLNSAIYCNSQTAHGQNTDRLNACKKNQNKKNIQIIHLFEQKRNETIPLIEIVNRQNFLHSKCRQSILIYNFQAAKMGL